VAGSIVGSRGSIIRGIEDKNGADFVTLKNKGEEQILVIGHSNFQGLIETVTDVINAIQVEFNSEKKSFPSVLVNKQFVARIESTQASDLLEKEEIESHFENNKKDFLQLCMILNNNDCRRLKKQTTTYEVMKQTRTSFFHPSSI